MSRPLQDVDKEGGVRCPLCAFATQVKDSRPGVANSIRRRRRCLQSRCGFRFTTYESVYDDSRPIDETQLGVLVARCEQAGRFLSEKLDDLVKATKAARTIADALRRPGVAPIEPPQ